MRIGISVVSHEGQNIWQNGLGQNVIFLAELFQRLPFVQSVSLIDVGDQLAMPPQVEMNSRNLRIMRIPDATDEVDVIIEMGGVLDIQWLDLMRARGKKVVYYCCGQPFAALAEPAVFDKPTSFSRPDRCDEIWVLPEYHDFISFQRVLHRCPVHVIPYLWHPQFVEQRAQEVAGVLGVRYGYQPRAVGEAGEAGRRAGLRVAIFEPNISVAKTSSIPMLVCDEAYRADRGALAAMHVLNTLHLKDHPTMLYFANSLDLVRQHKATFHGRHDIVGFMTQHADAVVSHQWQNEQNYSYLDALYGDYPLIHNSPWLREAGYYYPDFDAQQGAAQLLRAAALHDSGLDDYHARARRVFDAVNPFNQHNLDEYAARLQHLCRGAKFIDYAASRS